MLLHFIDYQHVTKEYPYCASETEKQDNFRGRIHPQRLNNQTKEFGSSNYFHYFCNEFETNTNQA